MRLVLWLISTVLSFLFGAFLEPILTETLRLLEIEPARWASPTLRFLVSAIENDVVRAGAGTFVIAFVCFSFFYGIRGWKRARPVPPDLIGDLRSASRTIIEDLADTRVKHELGRTDEDSLDIWSKRIFPAIQDQMGIMQRRHGPTLNNLFGRLQALGVEIPFLISVDKTLPKLWEDTARFLETQAALLEARHSPTHSARR